MLLSKEIARVTNSAGCTFAVHLVPAGGQYGRADVVTNDHGQAMVEFYDTKHEGKKDFDHRERGQFVARYLLSTFADVTRGALLLSGVAPERWFLDAGNVVDVATALTHDDGFRSIYAEALTNAYEPAPATRKFVVTVRRVVVMTAEIEVEAADEDEATEAAIESAQNDGACWVEDTSDDSDYEVNAVEEVD